MRVSKEWYLVGGSVRDKADEWQANAGAKTWSAAGGPTTRNGARADR